MNCPPNCPVSPRYRYRIEAVAKSCAILSAVLGGANTYARLRFLFPQDGDFIRRRIHDLRRAGLITPFKGGRDYSLNVTDDGKRVVAGILHGIRSLTVKKVGHEEKA